MFLKWLLLALILGAANSIVFNEINEMKESVNKEICKGMSLDHKDCLYNLGNLSTKLTNNFTLNNITNTGIKYY